MAQAAAGGADSVGGRVVAARHGSHTAVISLTGEFDLWNAESLDASLQPFLVQEGIHLVVDLAAATFVDSTVLGILVGAARSVARGGGLLSLVSPSGAVLRVLEVTGFARVLAIDASLRAALARPRPPGGTGNGGGTGGQGSAAPVDP